MDDTTKPVETATPAAPSNDATPPATPPVNAVDPAEVERLRKEAEQARMRANQLENELKKKADEEEAARLKQLEENEEWKQLAEQERIKRETLEQGLEAEKRDRELKAATSEVFSQFPKEVVEIAEEVGLALSDVDDSAKDALKAKLDKIAAKVATEAKVTPNNPAAPATAPKEELLTRMRNGDRTARAEVIGNLESVKAMRRMAGLSD